MSQSIKIPKEIMELVYEQQACEILADQRGFIKAIYYEQRAVKLQALVWRTLTKMFPQTSKDTWTIDTITGVATKVMPVMPDAPKKSRKPRAAKSVAAKVDPANNLGD